MLNIINIENLDSIIAIEDLIYQYKDKYIKVKKVKNNINGNPTYHIRIFDYKMNNITEQYKGFIGRYYQNKKYISFTSFNLSSDISLMLI